MLLLLKTVVSYCFNFITKWEHKQAKFYSDFPFSRYPRLKFFIIWWIKITNIKTKEKQLFNPITAWEALTVPSWPVINLQSHNRKSNEASWLPGRICRENSCLLLGVEVLNRCSKQPLYKLTTSIKVLNLPNAELL